MIDYLEIMCSQTGYTPINKDIWDQLTKTERTAPGGLPVLVESLFNNSKDNYKEITELIMFLNWKIWYHSENHRDTLAHIYNNLWEKYDAWVFDNLSEEGLSYFLSTTD